MVGKNVFYNHNLEEFNNKCNEQAKTKICPLAMFSISVLNKNNKRFLLFFFLKQVSNSPNNLVLIIERGRECCFCLLTCPGHSLVELVDVNPSKLRATNTKSLYLIIICMESMHKMVIIDESS